MDSDYDDDFEASVAQEPAHKRMVIDPVQTKTGLEKAYYPSTSRTMPDDQDAPIESKGRNDFNGADGKRVQSMQNVGNDSSDYEQEFENDEEDEEGDKDTTPTKVKPEHQKNISNKKYSAAKDKSPLIKTDQFKNNRIPLQNLDEKPKVQDMTQKKLELENNKLKAQIKLLNEQLLRQGVRIKDLKQSNKKTVPREQSIDDKIRNIDRELSNTNKVFAQTEEEHQKLKHKLDRIKDPQHIFDLEKEVVETLQQIEDMKKRIKNWL